MSIIDGCDFGNGGGTALNILVGTAQDDLLLGQEGSDVILGARETTRS